jgi:hypothetical protein
MKNILFLILAVLLMIATRGHASWLGSNLHLPDFTLVALLIAGVYFRSFFVVFTLIVSAVAIDNYAIVHQGVSANCITPAYSFLPVTYYLVFFAGKYLKTLEIDKNALRNIVFVALIFTIQWVLATTSYYAFTASPWSKFPEYALKWSLVEIPLNLYWVLAVALFITLWGKISPVRLNKKAIG